MQFNGTSESDPMFSKYRLSETLTYGYFEMLGTLSKHAEGIECAIRNLCCILLIDASRLMEKFKFFTAFYHLSELRDREDLITAVITNLDYTM
jgi:rapamycin-insensitive companion of mTOR